LAGCTVVTGTGRQWNFPTNHPLYIGPLGFLGGLKDSLTGFDVIVAFGTGNPFTSLFYEGGSPIPDGSAFVHIDIDSWEMGKNYSGTMSILADSYWAARDIHEALDRVLTPAQRSEAQKRRNDIAEKVAQGRQKAKEQLQSEWDKAPISPMRLVGEIRNQVPANAAFVGAGGTSGRTPFAQLMELTQPDSFFDGHSALGFLLPGTLGVKLALPTARPRLLREGDMYGVQACGRR
jgi:thiamine pyrophosphate-dependent acetolactate synthase large subunit-like protein